MTWSRKQTRTPEEEEKNVDYQLMVNGNEKEADDTVGYRDMQASSQ